MPQVQVLERTPDPRQEQVLKSIQDANAAIERRKTLDLYNLQIQQSIKNAEDDREKQKHTRIKDANEYFLKLLERTDPETALGIVAKTYPDAMMPWLNGMTEHNDLISKLGKTSQEKLRGSQAQALDIFSGGNPETTGGNPPPINDISDGGGAIPTPTRSSLLAPRANLGGVSLVRGNDLQEESRLRSLGEQKAKTEVASKTKTMEIDNSWNNYLAAATEMGGPGLDPATALIKDVYTTAKSKLVNMPNYTAFKDNVGRSILGLARQDNGGRPSDKDSEWVKDAILNTNQTFSSSVVKYIIFKQLAQDPLNYDMEPDAMGRTGNIANGVWGKIRRNIEKVGQQEVNAYLRAKKYGYSNDQIATMLNKILEAK